ncbi:MAG: T9SS type A sorting domain-containing protein, partial [Candidatus Kapabacteria bacterium]|nr:T9SS type A sorting domain-containing protein [Candidatus Kapabacteria bacterium]
NDTIYNLVNYNMINGNNHDYRLVIQRLDSNSRYNEEVLLGDLHYNDTLFFKSNNRFDSKTIDLATYKETFSKIFPNPSDGKINLLLAIDYNKDNKITFLVSDITGQVIKEISTDYKDQVKLDMSNVTNGSYILQIKGYKHNKPTTETLQFKINK